MFPSLWELNKPDYYVFILSRLVTILRILETLQYRAPLVWRFQLGEGAEELALGAELLQGGVSGDEAGLVEGDQGGRDLLDDGGAGGGVRAEMGSKTICASGAA